MQKPLLEKVSIDLYVVHSTVPLPQTNYKNKKPTKTKNKPQKKQQTQTYTKKTKQMLIILVIQLVWLLCRWQIAGGCSILASPWVRP